MTAGMPAMVTLIEPGVHGAVVMGTQGCGVSTPPAAEVAAATWGLVIDMHIPKEAMFTFGSMSCTFAAGIESPSTAFAGNTESFEGALPIEHKRAAPLTTRWAMFFSVPHKSARWRVSPLSDPVGRGGILARRPLATTLHLCFAADQRHPFALLESAT